MRQSIPSKRMPALFIGHGSPLHAVQQNPFTESWACLGRCIGKARGVLVISAHWLTEGVFVTAMEQPRTVIDCEDTFPPLEGLRYPAPGSNILAARVKELLASTDVRYSNDWGLDQGSWTVLKHLYPQADVPIIQLSLDIRKPLSWHYDTARKLRVLREEGFLILGSGNIVHNRLMADFEQLYLSYPWAEKFQQRIAEIILSGREEELLNIQDLTENSDLAIPTPEHYLPLIYTLASRDHADDAVEFITPQCAYGSVGMMSMALWPSAAP